MENIFKPDQMRLLKEVISKQDPSLLPVVDKLGSVLLTGEQREALREVLEAELSETGLQEDYEPNSRGLLLEELIDRLWYFSTYGEDDPLQ